MADPGKMRLAQVALRLGVTDFGVPRAKAADIGREEPLEALAPFRRQLTMTNPGGTNAPVVVECGRQHLRREVRRERRALPLFQRKRAHQRKALLLLRAKYARPGIFAEAGEHRLRAHEVGRQHQLVPEHEAIDVEVVAVDLPSPRLARRGRAEDAYPIEPLAIFVGLAGDLESVLVELHDVSGSSVPGRAHALLQKSERRLP